MPFVQSHFLTRPSVPKSAVYPTKPFQQQLGWFASGLRRRVLAVFDSLVAPGRVFGKYIFIIVTGRWTLLMLHNSLLGTVQLHPERRSNGVERNRVVLQCPLPRQIQVSGIITTRKTHTHNKKLKNTIERSPSPPFRWFCIFLRRNAAAVWSDSSKSEVHFLPDRAHSFHPESAVWKVLAGTLILLRD